MFEGYFGDPTRRRRFVVADDGTRCSEPATRWSGTWAARPLLGRTAIDILKSGGYKLSALEIEAALRDHPSVAEVAVVGVARRDLRRARRRVGRAARAGPRRVRREPCRAFARERLAPYKLPRAVCTYDELPRNAMGKVQKQRLR